MSLDYYDSPVAALLKPFWGEPDVLRGCSHSYPTFACRNWSKSWCGYVGVPRGHPHWGLAPGDLVSCNDIAALPVGEKSPMALFIGAMSYVEGSQKCPLDCFYDVHGGVTWASPNLPGASPSGEWWFGFDCGHYNDLSPKDIVQEAVEQRSWRSGTYRTLDFVQYQITKLASQLAEVEMEFRDAN